MRKINLVRLCFIGEKIFVIILTLLSAAFILLTISACLLMEESKLPLDPNYAEAVFKEINISSIRAHVNILSASSRVTGYPGFYQAAQYILNYLNNLEGITVLVQNFSVLVPICEEATISIPELELRFPAYPLWPNGVQTCNTPMNGISGRIIYGGYSSLEDLDGKEIMGSIVILEFNSMDNWVNAVKLGAKGIIFIEPENTNRVEAETKFLLTPLNVPRLYVNRETGLKLKEIALSKNVTANIKLKMKWQNVIAQNIIGIISGTEIEDEIIILSAHYDSWSVVPSLAPGAEDAISSASLLELAKLLSEHPPKRTVWFVFYGGHWQALAGAREFVEHFLFQNETFSIGKKKILLQLSLYLSSENALLSWTNLGDMYLQREESTPYGWDGLSNLVFAKYIPSIRQIFGEEIANLVINPITQTIMAKSEILDSEPLSITGILSVTFLTAQSLRLNWQIPINTINKINWENLEKQLKIFFYVASSLANENFQGNPILTQWRAPERIKRTGVGSDIGPGQAGFVTLIGSVEEYDFTTGFYKPRPNALVEVYLSSSRREEAMGEGTISNALNPYTHIYACTDENGKFTIYGLAADTMFAHYNVLGYVLDYETGRIIYAPDFGLYGAGGGMYSGYNFLDIKIDRHPFFVKTVVFMCEEIYLFDIMNPLVFNVPRRGLHFYTSDAVSSDLMLNINEYLSHYPPNFYSFIFYPEKVAIIFLSQNISFELLLETPAKITIGILNNASQHHPLGSGVSSSSNTIYFTAFYFVSDLKWIVDYRLSILRSYHFFNPSAEKYYEDSKQYLEKAAENLKVRKYSVFYPMIYAAWQNLVNAYREVTSTSRDVVNASVIFYAFMIPFAYVFERLAFNFEGRKRLLAIIALLLLLTILAYFMHPGFKMASNIFVSILGITISIPIILIQLIIFVGLFSFLRFIRKQVMGSHFADISRGSAFLMSISMGLSNMRRRMLRTILNLMTVILFTSCLISLTSFSMVTTIRAFSIGGQTTYEGMLLKQSLGSIPFSEGIISAIQAYLGENVTVALRSWIYPPPTGRSEWSGSWKYGGGIILPVPIYGPKGKAEIKGLLGLQPEETEITGVDKILKEGRWFNKMDVYAAIINEKMRKQLNAAVGDKIYFMGLELNIIGVIDSNLFGSILDLDQRGLNPLDVSATPIVARTTYIPMSLEDCLIIPYSLALQYFGGGINSIAIKHPDKNRITEVAKAIISGAYSMLEIYVGYNGTIDIYRLGVGAIFIGWESILVPVVIASLTLLMTMLGSVHERIREIAVLGAIGLSPLHIAGIFLVEFTIYALLGTTLGYVLGIILINILYYLQAIPTGFNVNFSSSATLFTLSLSSAAIIGTAIYPAFKAGRMVTPSLMRKWEVKTKPVGDEWEIPLPIKIPESEIIGLIMYLYEFFKAHSARDVGVFRVTEVSYDEDALTKTLEVNVALAPWDSGLAQIVRIVAKKEFEEKSYNLVIHLKRVRGRSQTWISRNKEFIRLIRNQFVLWNTLRLDEKREYTLKGTSTLKSRFY